ncbi:MAG: putative acetyltransferase [Candidatus Paceibacteria bacterium]|jgi:predicted acetyltransferase
MELRFDYQEENIREFGLFGGDIKVGRIQIRKKPTKSDVMPEGFESHIFYEIQEEFKGKGYGTKILELGLKEIDSDEVILTCRDPDIHSRRIIEKNGGELVDTKEGKNGVVFHRFIIRR